MHPFVETFGNNCTSIDRRIKFRPYAIMHIWSGRYMIVTYYDRQTFSAYHQEKAFDFKVNVKLKVSLPDTACALNFSRDMSSYTRTDCTEIQFMSSFRLSSIEHSYTSVPEIVHGDAAGIADVPAPVGLDGEISQILASLGDVMPNIADPSELTPLSGNSLYRFRRLLEEKCPNLAEWSDSISSRLNLGQAGVRIDHLGLSGATLDEKRYFLYAFACLIGRPTGTDAKSRKVLWDVKARKIEADYFPTFSEHDNEAEYHTDTQYYQNPERYFLLYSIRAARCGGGLNTFASGWKILAAMMESEEGRDAVSILSTTAIPFRIPSVFATASEPQYTWAPILSNEPLIRFRLDTFADGEQAFPSLDWTPVRRAVGLLVQVTKSVATPETVLADDSLIVVNNHEMLHARTRFQDSERHLIRVRMHG